MIETKMIKRASMLFFGCLRGAEVSGHENVEQGKYE